MVNHRASPMFYGLLSTAAPPVRGWVVQLTNLLCALSPSITTGRPIKRLAIKALSSYAGLCEPGALNDFSPIVNLETAMTACDKG